VLFDQPWGVGAQDAGPHERPGDPGRAHHRPSGRGDLAAAVGPGDHLGGEQLLQAVQVALTRGGQEPLDQAMPLPGLRTKVGPQSRQPAARTAIDLAAVGLRQPGADVLLSLDPRADASRFRHRLVTTLASQAAGAAIAARSARCHRRNASWITSSASRAEPSSR
jgi:hypothetical protein